MKTKSFLNLNLEKRLAVVTKQIEKVDKVNRYFFPLEDDEKLSASDAIWFYGVLGGAILLTMIVSAIVLF